MAPEVITSEQHGTEYDFKVNILLHSFKYTFFLLYISNIFYNIRLTFGVWVLLQ